VQLRTAVHILVRRVQQLSQVIVEAEKDIPRLNDQDEEFLDRVLGTLGISHAPVPGITTLAGLNKPGKVNSPALDHSRASTAVEQHTTPEGSLPNTNMPGMYHDRHQLAQNDNLVGYGHAHADFEDVATTLANMESIAAATTKMSGGDDNISPDWPFPTLDNMLNFDIFEHNDLSMQFLMDMPAEMPLPFAHQQEIAPVGQIEPVSQPQEDNNSASGDEDNTELVNQLSARLGSLRLAPDGKLRYFGTASNLHLIDNQTRSGENFMLRTPSRVNTQSLLEVADLHQAVDVQLEEHLLRLFFTWHNPSSYIVDEEVFYTARQSWFNTGVQNSYYNDVLKDAM
jgi:hypothetical protein